MKSRLLKLVAMSFSAMVLSLGTAFAQQDVTVNGTVVDESGQPVIGAAIMVKGTTIGAVSDENGAYTIDTKSDAVFVVSSIGYVEQEIPVNGRSRIDITLAEDNTELEATVVVAYGEVRSRDFTGAVQQVKVSDSPQAQMGFTNPGQFLQGNVPGVQMTPPSTVGDSGSMLVRGRRSIGGTDQGPLLVVDGMIYKGDMLNLDPNNIESMQVLKDASSLAAYGSQAAQGVIMITTKKGKVGRPTINVSTTQSFNMPTYKHKYFDVDGYVHLRNARLGVYDDPSTAEDEGASTAFMTDIEKKNYAAGNSVDWFDAATRTGWTQNYSARVSGGSEGFNYSFSVGRSNQNGIQIGNNFQRTNLNARLNSKINDYIEVGLTMDYSATGSQGGTASTEQRASPLGSIYFDNTGKMRKYADGQDDTTTNPLWNSDPSNGYEREMTSNRSTYNGTVKLSQPWIKGLSYTFNVSYGRNIYEMDQFYHEAYYPSMASGNNEDGYTVLNLNQANGSISSRTTTNWVMDNIITYAHLFGKHSINSSLVYTRDSNQVIGHSLSGTDYTDYGNTLLSWYALSQAGTRVIDNGTYTLHTDVGYLARLMYSYDSRYHVNLSFRRDGSSVFGSERKWGNFPAVGLAWSVSNEKFMQKFTKVDDLKLKLSWGINGSQTLNPYGTLSQLQLGRGTSSSTNYGINTGEGVAYSQFVSVIGNQDLGWQSTESINGGFEGTFFRRRLSVDVNAYFSKTTDQIFNRTIPIMGAGVNSQQATMGQVNNWGVEAIVNTTNIQKKDFNWTSQLTFNMNRNKLVHLWGGNNEEDDLTNGLFIGQSLDVIWWYDQQGVVQETGKGSLPTTQAGWGDVIDQDGNGVLDNNDKIFLGNRKENFRISFANTLNYKKFQLYFMFTGTFGGGGYARDNNTFAYYTHYGFAYANAIEMPYWTPYNHSTTHVSPQSTDQEKTWMVYNSYGNVRLQNLSLSYDLSNLVKGWGVKGARFSVSGQNLFYIAPFWKLSDPDARGRQGMLMKTFTVGFNFTI